MQPSIKCWNRIPDGPGEIYFGNVAITPSRFMLARSVMGSD